MLNNDKLPRGGRNQDSGSSGADLARRAIALGGHLSFSGIAAFPKSDALRAIARDVPLDRILVETDAPYLAPPPPRGEPNEPAHVRHTAARLAPLFGLDEAAFASRTTENFHRLFPRAVPRIAPGVDPRIAS